MKAPSRLICENVSFRVGETESQPGHQVTVNLGYAHDRLVEIAFCEAGKVGHGIHLILSDLGIKVSRALQHRNPDTGEGI